MSRTELRERNFLAKGDLLPTGERLGTCVEVGQTMHRAVALLGEPPTPSGPGKVTGRGIGCNRHPYGRAIWFRDKAAAWLSLQADGTLLIRCGVTDLGAGQAASLCQIAAEVLGAPLDDISIYIGDSALNPPAGGTFATRQLYMSGNAVLQAARELRDRMAPVAADLLGVPPGELEFAAGRVWPAGAAARPPDGGRRARRRRRRRRERDAGGTGGRLRAAVDQHGAPVHLAGARPARSTRAPGRATRSPTTPTARTRPTWRSTPRPGRSGCCGTRPATTSAGRSTRCGWRGRSRAAPCRASGTRSPRTWTSQDGYVQAALFANYLIPNAQDFPDVLVDIVESGEGKGPLGARGIGEPPIGNVAATIASAIQDAIGVRPAQLPMTPERVLALIDMRDT